MTRPRPLTPAVLHILLALSGQDRHGYAIMKAVEADTEGKVSMGPGTLYGSIARMMADGLITEGTGPTAGDDPRRVYYRLTAQGARALAQELDRYRAVLTLADRRGTLHAG